MTCRSEPTLVPSLVDRAGARLRSFHDHANQRSVLAGANGIASIVLTRELGQGSYVAGVACLDASGRVMSQAILGPGWGVVFEEPADTPDSGSRDETIAQLTRALIERMNRDLIRRAPEDEAIREDRAAACRIHGRSLAGEIYRRAEEAVEDGGLSADRLAEWLDELTPGWRS